MATASTPSSRRLSRLLLVALCATAAGCGGDDAASDAARIEVAVKRFVESATVRDQCEAVVSRRFVREVYRTLAHCREANRLEPGEDHPADTATVSATRIDGDSATTGVTLTNVKGARATGRLALVKVGDGWRVDRLGIDFLRSVFGALPDQAETAEERRILSCLATATRTLSDGDVRRVGHLIFGHRLTERELPARVVRCIRDGAQQELMTT